jgi:hypothetical protein
MINSYTHSGVFKPDVVDAKGFGWKVETVTKFAANELTLHRLRGYYLYPRPSLFSVITSNSLNVINANRLLQPPVTGEDTWAMVSHRPRA